jgi:hypothetical protein
MTALEATERAAAIIAASPRGEPDYGGHARPPAAQVRVKAARSKGSRAAVEVGQE